MTETATTTTTMTAPDPSLYPRLGLHTVDDSTALRYDPANNRTVCFVTTMDDGTEVSWDLCGRCLTHITICMCKDGPALPSYLREVTPQTFGGVQVADATKPASFVLPERKQVVRNAVTGRKVRADVGKPRGPRVPSEPTAPAPPSKNVLSGPCALHTAESRANADGTYTCTVEGCAGVA